MITAKIVKYYNDYNQKAFDKTFENLDELADWIFDQMQLDYTKKPGCDFLTFPTDRFGKWYEISVQPNYGGYVYWIHEIDSESGTISREYPIEFMTCSIIMNLAESSSVSAAISSSFVISGFPSCVSLISKPRPSAIFLIVP